LLACYVNAAFPSLGKKYYIGGSFTQTVAYGNVNSGSQNNIVSWDNNAWKGLGDGFNGAVHDIYVDTVMNVYAVGNFSRTGTVATGPVAMLKADKWEGIGADSGAVWGNNSLVNSVTVDCFNKPNLKQYSLNCDIYVGGSFTIRTAEGLEIKNVARYSTANKKWEKLEGTPSQVETSPVSVVYKKEGGNTLLFQSAYYLWVGGSFGLYMFNNKDKDWTTYTSTVPSAVKVNWLQYKRNLVSTDEVYICGDFSFSCANGKTCKNVAKLDYKTRAFTAVGATQLKGAVDVCVLGENNYLYLVGKDLTGLPASRYLAKAKLDNPEKTFWIPGVPDTYQITSPLNDIDVCENGDATCESGSVAYVGDGIMGFYNTEDNSYQYFGNGTNGNNRAIRATFTINSGLAIKGSVFFLLAALLFVLF